MALRSSLPFAVAGPDSSISVVLAALVATVIQREVAAGAPICSAPALIAMSLTTGLTGLLLCILGFTHAGRAIRFVPYPVIGGFLGATGWLMFTGAVQVVTEEQFVFYTLGDFASTAVLAKIAPGVVVAIALFVLLRRFRNPFVLPAVLLTAFVSPIDPVGERHLARGRASDGWMFSLSSAAALSLPWKAEPLHSFPWAAAAALAGDVLAVMFVTIDDISAQYHRHRDRHPREADVERDLKVLARQCGDRGLGGYASCTSLSRSILVRTAGATSRLAGLTVAAISAGVLIADPAFLGYVPKFVLGGLFCISAPISLSMADPSSRRLLPIEYLSLIAIAR